MNFKIILTSNLIARAVALFLILFISNITLAFGVETDYDEDIAASISIVGGPTLRIPGIAAATVIQLSGYNTNYPVRWKKSGSSEVWEGPILYATEAGTYYAEVNYSTNPDNPFWRQEGSLTIQALNHYQSVNGSNPLNQTTTQLCVVSNGSSYISKINWMFNGQDEFTTSTDPACRSVWKPGSYYAQVTYQYGSESVTHSLPATEIYAATYAPQVTWNKTTVDPVTETFVTITNFSSFSSMWWYKNNQQQGLMSGATLKITSPGRYYFYGYIYGTGYVYSYGYEVTKGSIPVPVVGSDAAELTYQDPEMKLSVNAVYNKSYTWYYNDVAIANATTQAIDIHKPGNYKVTACATHSDGQVECKTSAAYTVSGESLKINYVSKKTSRVEGLTDAAQMSTLPKEKVTHATTYFDGFVRPIQTVGKESSPLGRDVVSINTYDQFGREQKKYLPASVPSHDGKYRYIDPSSPEVINSFYQASNDNIANTTTPYAETIFEASPLNRVKEQGAPGEAWQTGTGHTVRTNYTVYKQTGTASDVLLWKENGQGQLQTNGYYADESLMITEITNENGNVYKEYTDKTGKKILTESPGDTNAERLRTYYVYDAIGRLKFVLPPNMSLKVSSVPFTVSPTHLQQECYSYQYDERGRVIIKRIPGAEAVYYVYDKWDRQVLSQTGNQRVAQQWSFTKYDALDRPVMSGEVVIAGDQPSVQQAVNTFYASVSSNPTLRYEEKGTAIHNYTNRSYPILTGEQDVNTVTYYDTYSFIPSNTTQYNFQPQADLSLTEYFTRTRGLLTGTKTRILGTGNFLLTVNYYDKRLRPVQVISDHHLGGKDIVSSQYDFEGKVLKNKRQHAKGSEQVTITDHHTYDFAGRLLSVSHQVNSEAPVTIVENRYNELGQVIEKNLHRSNINFWQSQDYAYNIRGWITGVNASQESGPLYPDMYGFELGYNEPITGGLSTSAQYNGNISAFKEVRPFEREMSQPVASGYAYGYDASDRLMQANYVNIPNPTLNNTYNETLSYDANGNITTLQRKGTVDGIAKTVDELSYAYTGNQLQNVTDTGDKQVGFKDVTNTTDYTYDANGNVSSDANKGISNIGYNILNLPATITYSDGRTIKFSYTASGEKLSQIVRKADQTIKVKYDYADGIVYKNDTLQSIPHAEGRLVPSSSNQYTYEYFLKDHLGNVRTTFTTKKETEQAVATLETANATVEQSNFLYYDEAVKINTPLFDHTNQGSTYYSARLTGSANEQFGLAKSLSVMAGDTVRAEVYVKYLDNNTNNWTSALTNFMAAIAAGTAPAGTVIDGGAAGSTGGATPSFTALLDKSSESGSAPKAYLNYLVFNRNFVLLNGGFVRISEAAREYGQDGAHEKLAVEIPITQAGYVYVYYSNDNAALGGAQIETYWDDFTVEQTKSPIVEETVYYPFGSIAQSNSREGMTVQRYKYNGKEQLTEEGLDWADYGARMYDAALGRWHVIDPLAEKYAPFSPYNYVVNNPLKYVDPDGREVEFFSKDKVALEAAKRDYDRIRRTATAGEKVKALEKRGKGRPHVVIVPVKTGVLGREEGEKIIDGMTLTTYNQPISLALGQYVQIKNGKKIISSKDDPGIIRNLDGYDATRILETKDNAYLLLYEYGQEGSDRVLAHEMIAHIYNVCTELASYVFIKGKGWMRTNKNGVAVNPTDEEHRIYGNAEGDDIIRGSDAHKIYIELYKTPCIDKPCSVDTVPPVPKKF